MASRQHEVSVYTRTIFYSIILILLVSCSTLKVEPTADQSFKPYVERFERLYGNPVVGIDISIGRILDANGELMERVGAACFMTTPRRIVFNKHIWEKGTELYKEMVVFHELGHCLLGRQHTDLDEDYVKPLFLRYDGCPESIMHSATTKNRMNDYCYKAYYSYYLAELFLSKELRLKIYGSGR